MIDARCLVCLKEKQTLSSFPSPSSPKTSPATGLVREQQSTRSPWLSHLPAGPQATVSLARASPVTAHDRSWTLRTAAAPCWAEAEMTPN